MFSKIFLQMIFFMKYKSETLFLCISEHFTYFELKTVSGQILRRAVGKSEKDEKKFITIKK